MTRAKRKPTRNSKQELSELQEMDWNRMLATLSGEALILLGQGTPMQEIVRMTAQGTLHWKDGQKKGK